MKKTGVITLLSMVAAIGFSVPVINADFLQTVNMQAGNAPLTNGNSRIHPFSDSSYLLNMTNYEPGSGANVRGGAILTYSDEGSRVFFVHGGTANTLKASADERVQLLVIWDRSDFIATNSGGWAFDNSAASSVTMDFTRLTVSNGMVHLVIRDSGTYYISQGIADATGVPQIITFSGADDIQWATFDPADLTGAATSSFTSREFNNVEAIGYFADIHGSPGATGNHAQVWLNSFTANLVPVPEPATLGMLILGVATVFGARKKFVR